MRTVAYGGTSVVVIVAVPFSDVQDTLDALHRVLFIVLPIVLLAAAAATWLSVGSALRPVDELRAAADAVVASGGKAAPRLAVPEGADELRRLAETLNRMLARVHGAGEQQRAFIADAAHELRSPLASVLTQLEVALSTPTSPQEWPVIAADVHADAERLRRIADDLLLLARLDAGAPASSDLVDVTALAGAQGEPLLVRGDEQSLGRVFDNLVSNARKHAHEVRVTSERVGSWALVVVDDDGPGVPAGGPRAGLRTVRPARLSAQPGRGRYGPRAGDRPCRGAVPRRRRDAQRLTARWAARDRTAAGRALAPPSDQDDADDVDVRGDVAEPAGSSGPTGSR